MNETILSLAGLTKVYPGVIALKDFSLDFRPGEVHALLGENGAGKSTLIKIIAGAIEPDAGSIKIGTESYSRLTPHEARRLGIEVIYQEFNLMPSLSAAENIYFGEKTGRFVSQRAMEIKAQTIFDDFEIDIDPRSPVRDLPASRQQIVEIAKAVSRNAGILIMDEPTAPLSMSEVEHLFRLIRKFRERGTTIIYISHRIDELFTISDYVTVMRDGQLVTTLETARTSRQELISLMVGRELKETYPERSRSPGKTVFELRGVTGNGDRDISFRLHEGEILGMAGLVGAGRTELAKVIAGAAGLETGEILLDGRPVTIRSPRDALRYGIGLIPENRKEEGCFLNMDIAWNISFANLPRISKGFLVQKNKERILAESFKDLMRIKTPTLMQKVKLLSGGNQQKVVLSKVLATESRILIFDEPTRGIDVGARQDIYKLMDELTLKGHSIIMITSDMEELLGMSDRIIVIAEGRLTGTLERGEFSQKAILELASTGAYKEIVA
ncbi:MAG: sugar ABC transporter ATP-binding protein [Treponema sp.]|jgi:ribose transport system ATP-binding protein|nr:sugar ABC transporter ATP-binding protein [Treponema sp.]